METTTSADGTVIAYERTGDGPPLIVSVGAFCTRHTFVAPPELAREFTVYTYDRRGRGDSGDTQPFSPEREYEDIAAVAAATGLGTLPYVFGHSSGGAIALRAAAAGVPFKAVVSYEAPFAIEETPPPAVPDPAGHIRELVRTGRRAEAVRFWMTGVIHLPEQVVAQMERGPWLKGMEELTHTLPYDIAVTDGGIPVAELARITVPVMILGGKNSPGWFQRSVAEQASATPDARLVMVDGYDHNAPPEVIAPILTGFYATI